MGRPSSDLDDYLDWQERLENYKASGLEVDVFCLQEGVSRSTFYRWVDRLKDGIPESMEAENAAQEQAEYGQRHAARHLDGTDEGGGREGVRSVRNDVRGEVPEGNGVPGRGPRGAAGILRLPGRTLGAYPHDESDRINVRNGAVTNPADQGLRLSDRLPDDGVSADAMRRTPLAYPQRGEAAG